MHRTLNNVSNLFYVAKAFAILLVIAAHMTFSQDYPVAEIIRSSLGQVGVVVFFFTSGYFYSRENGDFRHYWGKKLKTLLIPWMIFSLIVFTISRLQSRNLENLIISYIKNFFGIGTIYWYMTVMIIMMFIFKFFYTKKYALYLCMLISVVSIVLSFIGIIEYNQYINQYLNIFNWLGFFALGIYFKTYNLLDKVVNLKCLIISLIGTVFSVSLAVIRGFRIEAYIDITSLLVELFGFVLIINLSNILSKSRVLCDVGKKSFFVYLMHIQVVGLINTRLPYNWFFFILRPFIGLTVCYIIACCVKFVLNKIKLSNYNFIFGLDR